ncbi:hypothetical protein [Variovorax sp. JS1663]|uniref:hypothetical protein n=1 Tax=Variovorax sp. JS1663 TaxID=1851577 RepID=UPI00117FF369|nr:hypothetical protein [Variovorax sp. JS1663]
MKQSARTPERARVASVFGLKIEQIHSGMHFEHDFSAAPVFDWKRNEFNQLSDDFRDVTDRKIERELNNGLLVVHTVGDYCNHMVRCYRANAKEVNYVHGLGSASSK